MNRQAADTQSAKTAAWVDPRERRRWIVHVLIFCGVSLMFGFLIGWHVYPLSRPHEAAPASLEAVHSQPQKELPTVSPLDKKHIEKLLAEERYTTATRTRSAVLREIDELLKEAWKRELLIEDGKVLTIKNNRVAIGSKEHGFVNLEYDTYPVLVYRVHRPERKEKESTKGKPFGYGIVGDLHHPVEPYLFRLVWIGKAVDPPEKIQALTLEKSRLAVVIP